MILPPDVVRAAQEHAIAAYPQESCGVVLPHRYLPMPNLHETPNTHFRLDEAALIGLDVLAVLHSHPGGPAHPSRADMEQQAAMDIPWGIIATDGVGTLPPVLWGDFTLGTPLLGRDFVHGVYDCYSLIRGYYWQERKIKLPDFPRDDEWWAELGEDLYVENFARAGFRRIAQEDVLTGDVWLGPVASRVVNHGGVLLEGGLGLHHLHRRLSSREPVLRWRRHITHWLRYVGGSP